LGITKIGDLEALLRVTGTLADSFVGFRSRAALHALFTAIRMDETGAPSIRENAINSP
jgi:hypothetical protein